MSTRLSRADRRKAIVQTAAQLFAEVGFRGGTTRELAKRAVRFKAEKGRLPSLTAMDPWEKRMAEGIAFLQRKVKEGGANG